MESIWTGKEGAPAELAAQFLTSKRVSGCSTRTIATYDWWLKRLLALCLFARPAGHAQSRRHIAHIKQRFSFHTDRMVIDVSQGLARLLP